MRNRAVVRGVRTLFVDGTATGLSDGQLLERYLRRGDDSAEAAFRALVERHGPMVLRACRGVLRDAHSAEDAFQATFLILARKAGSIRRRDSVASWLFGVARRVAGRAARQQGRRDARERQGVEMAGAVDRSSSDRPTLPEVQEEVDRLPERYRAPVVLCYLEGLTQEEAAIRLQLPASTVRVRLMRARSRLRDRLGRRGLGPGALAGLAAGRAEVVIPAPLVDETVKAAIRFAVGRAAGASGPVAALAEGVIRTMFLARLKTAAFLLAAMMGASLGIVATLAGSAPSGQGPPAPEKPQTRPGDQGHAVTVDTAKKSGWMQTTAQPGSLQAFDSADVYARIPGFIKMLKVDIGSRVKKGEILAEIEAPEIVADVEKARAEVERARVRRTKAMAALQVAQAALELEHAKVQAADAAIAASEAQELYRSKQLGRIRQLVARGQVEQRLEDEELDRYVSAQSELKMARSQRAVVQSAEAEARAKVEMARADAEAATIDVRIAEVGVEHANDHLGYTRIVSPYDGVVTRRPYHVGELVGSPNVGKAAPLFTIVRSDLMRVVVPVPDRDTRFLDLGDPAKIWIDALPGAVFEGVVSRTAYEVDTHNRTLRVEIDLPNKDGRLRPGQHGRVEIQLGAREDALTIRSEAIWDEEHTGLGACFRIVGGRAVRTPVTFARVDGRRVEILDGLKEGDVVIIPQGRPISDGQPVIARPIEGR